MTSDLSGSDYLKANYEKSVEQAIQDTTFFLLGFPEPSYPTHDFLTWTLQEFLQNVNSLGNAVLEWAVKIWDEELVKLLVGRDDIDINTKDKSGLMPLSRAAERGHEAIVRLLVDRGAAIDIKDRHGETA